MGISFSNNWDTWAGINQCVVVTIWQRTIEDRDQDCQCANNPLLAMAVPGEEDPGPLTVTRTHLERPGATIVYFEMVGEMHCFINFQIS